MSCFEVLGRGVATSDAQPPDRFRRSVRYADPLSWAVVAATAAALDGSTSDRDHVALVTVGRALPLDAMIRVRDGAQQGLVSPTVFPASIPSSPAGLACFLHGLRGPSLHFAGTWSACAMPLCTVATSWLRRDLEVLIVRCDEDVVAASRIGRSLLEVADRCEDASKLQRELEPVFHDLFSEVLRSRSDGSSETPRP